MSGTGLNWTDQHPRFLADLTGDGRADIVGFGDDGVWTALSNGDGTLPATAVRQRLRLGSIRRWRVDQHPRFLADLTGDGRADIVGFGDDGVWTALSNGDGTFQPPQFVLADFGGVNSAAGGSTSIRGSSPISPATAGPTSSASATTACGRRSSNGDGTFQPPRFVLADFGASTGGWRVDQHPRFLADLTGDGRADIVGFGDDGVWTALSNGDGTFQPPQFVLADFGSTGGWRVDQHPRFLADLTGDGRADIVGFGDDGVWTALSNGDGTFQPAAVRARRLRLRTRRLAGRPASAVPGRHHRRRHAPTSSASATTECGRRSATATARFQPPQFVLPTSASNAVAGGSTSTRGSSPTSPVTAAPTSSASATTACGRRSAPATARSSHRDSCSPTSVPAPPTTAMSPAGSRLRAAHAQRSDHDRGGEERLYRLPAGIAWHGDREGLPRRRLAARQRPAHRSLHR